MAATARQIKLDGKVVLHSEQAAARAGVAPKTWSGYVTRKSVPAADDWIDDRTPVWYPKTVDAWLKTRPRKGRTNRT